MEIAEGEINWLLTCRICLKTEDHNMKCIFSDMPVLEDIATKIIKCGGIPVNILDGMPDRICDRCFLNLEIAYNFRNTCQKSYERLHKMINTREEKPVICEETSAADIKQECDQDEIQIKYSDLEHLPKIISEKDSFEILYLDDGTLGDENFTQELEIQMDITNDIQEPEDNCVNNKNKPNKIELKPKRGLKRLRKDKPTGGATNYICYLCGNIYPNKSKLGQHIKLHTAEKEHECEICGKRFAQAAQLSRHMNSHTGNRPYKCKYCPSSFADPSTCIKHERIHTNHRPFKCLDCGKAFAYSNVLKVHQKTHTGEKPFGCSICDKKFTQLHHKKSHEKTHFNVIGARAAKNKEAD